MFFFQPPPPPPPPPSLTDELLAALSGNMQILTIGVGGLVLLLAFKLLFGRKSMPSEVALTNKSLAETKHEWVHMSYKATSAAESATIYAKWAAVYDSTMTPDKYQAPFGLVRHLMQGKLLGDKKDPTSFSCAILDVGCGTGILGQCLRDEGFTIIDGLDNSQEMLDVAKPKALYRSLFLGTLGKPLNIKTGAYAAAVSSGTFTPGHAPAHSLREVARCVRVGGIVSYTLKLDLHDASDFPAVHESMVKEGIWESAGHSKPYTALPGDKVMLIAFTWRVKRHPGDN